MTGPVGETSAGSPSHHRTVAKEGGWAGLFSLFGAAIRYVNNMILTRMLGAELYGLYALANTAVTVVTIPASLGLPNSLVYFVASYAETNQWGKLKWAIGAAFRAVIVSSLVGAGLILLASPWASRSVFEKNGLVLPLSGLALALPFLALYSVCAGGLQGLRAIRGKVFIERIAHPLALTVLLLCGGYWLGGLRYVLVSYFVAAVFVFGLGLFWLARRLKTLPVLPPPPSEWKRLLSFSTPVAFMQFLNYFILWSDILVMGAFRPAVEVGVYAIASRLAAAVNMPTEAIGVSLAPSFSGLMGKGDMAGLKRLFHTSTRWIFLLAAFICTGLTLGGIPILHLFGKDFRAGHWVLCILAVGQMISASFGANGILITMTGHPKVNLANAIFLGVGNLALCVGLVPRYGALGAASAAAISLTLVNLTRAVEIWLILKIGPWDRTIPKPLLALGISVLLGGGAYHAFGPWVATPVGLGTFALAWWVSKPEPEDTDMLKRAWGKLRRNPS